jgi:hypothetical protein
MEYLALLDMEEEQCHERVYSYRQIDLGLLPHP